MQQDQMITQATSILAFVKGVKGLPTLMNYGCSDDGAVEGLDWKFKDKEEFIDNLNLPVCTQSLLQRKLREVYNIHVAANTNFYNKKEMLGYYYSIDKFDKYNIHDGKDYDLSQLELIGEKKAFDSFEEALEVGLSEGLSLIKN
jgi:hypothetical protein